MGVSMSSAAGGVDWTYSAQFRNKWTDLHLSSAVVSVDPGVAQDLNLDGYSVQVRVPAQGEGTVGMLIADPCLHQSQWCPFADVFDIQNTLQTVLNSLAEHGELDYWMNVGDLFYDQQGDITTTFFAGLSMTTQAKVHGVTMGNHDYWNDGSPWSKNLTYDNFGNGMMQWYAMDAMSAKADEAQPFDFSANPFAGEPAHFSNFFSYNMLGNVAFISFSGQASWSESESYFAEACQWVGEQDPDLLVLLGHWDADNLGCQAGMATPEAFSRLMGYSGCGNLADRVKFFEGHNHCNHIIQSNTGFMIGSFGMSGCGDFGIPIMDTRDGQAVLYYFQLGAGGQRSSNWGTIMDCLKSNGYAACKQYAQVWMQQDLPSASRTRAVRAAFV